jgi:hypothetical protein
MKRLACLLALLLAGCATNGVKMTEEDAARCKDRGCTAWTEDELMRLAERFFIEGYKSGAKSEGRSL